MRASSWETRLGLLQAKPKYTEAKREVLKKYFGKATLGEATKPVASRAMILKADHRYYLILYGRRQEYLFWLTNLTSAAPVYYLLLKLEIVI